MYRDLVKLNKVMDLPECTLKNFDLYSKKIDNSTCKRVTNERVVNFKIEFKILPHLIKIRYAFNDKKTKIKKLENN